MADVAAFANANGGLLVIGVATTKHSVQKIEYCSAVVGTNADGITSERVNSLLRDHSFPPVDVDVRTYAGEGTEGKRITVVVIDVRAVSDGERPVFVHRMVSDDEESVPHAVGWPTRHADGTHWEHASRIQQLVSLGRRPPSWTPTGTPDLGSATQRLDDILDSMPEWESWGRLVVKAFPLGGHNIADFYDQFRSRANRWRGVREMGFNLGLAPYGELVPRRGDLVSEITDRTYLSVSSHGGVTSAAVASPQFLGWSLHQNESSDDIRRLLINPYPLVEFVVETVRFAYELVGPAVSAPAWRLVARLEHMTDRVPAAFVPMGPGEFLWRDRAIPARDNEVEAIVGSSGDWGIDSFRLLEDLLGQAFGLRRDDIPLAQDGRIDSTTWRRQ